MPRVPALATSSSRALIRLSLPLIIVGCASTPERPAPAPSAPTTSLTTSIPPAAKLPEGAVLTLDALRAMARERSLNRAIADADLRLARAHLTQAQAWANPELEVEGGRARTTSGESLGVGRVTLRQRLELPTKRDRRADAARAEQATATVDAQALAVDLDRAVESAAVEAAVIQRAIADAQRAVELTRGVTTAVQRRLDAGEGSRTDLLRAQVDQHQAEMDLAQRQRSLSAARAALRALCGDALPTTFAIDLDLDLLPTLTLAEARDTAEQHNPELRREDAQIEQRRLELRREDAAAAPDLTVGVFTGRETDSRNVGVTLGVELPLWDRNQGGIAAARAQLDRDQAQRESDRRRILADVEAAWFDYDAAAARVQDYAKVLSPLADEALAAATRSYDAGEAGLLDVLDARRTAHEVARQRLEAVRDAQASRIRLDRAIGMPIAITPPQPTSSAPGATP